MSWWAKDVIEWLEYRFGIKTEVGGINSLNL